MINIREEIEKIQDQIEKAKDHTIRSNLFLKKIDLLKLKESYVIRKEDYQEVINQLEKDITKKKV